MAWLPKGTKGGVWPSVGLSQDFRYGEREGVGEEKGREKWEGGGVGCSVRPKKVDVEFGGFGRRS